jgi:hypothetical protein
MILYRFWMKSLPGERSCTSSFLPKLGKQSLFVLLSATEAIKKVDLDSSKHMVDESEGLHNGHCIFY